jgi:hypothetical protein|tara:strand:+ start:10588 stop:10800 length:213 start_codon:yes stop_codon:yes gene_type:complete
MMDEAKLSKGAIPRLSQEVYFHVNERGQTMINRKLTIREFIERLNQLQNQEYEEFEIEDKVFDNFESYKR